MENGDLYTVMTKYNTFFENSGRIPTNIAPKEDKGEEGEETEKKKGQGKGKEKEREIYTTRRDQREGEGRFDQGRRGGG